MFLKFLHQHLWARLLLSMPLIAVAALLSLCMGFIIFCIAIRAVIGWAINGKANVKWDGTKNSISLNYPETHYG